MVGYTVVQGGTGSCVEAYRIVSARVALASGVEVVTYGL